MIIVLIALHLIFMAMGTGMSFSNVVNLRLSRGQSGEMAKGLALQRRMISRIGDGVITLIWATGLLLIWITQPLFSTAFIVKIVAVVALTACHFMARRTAGEIMRTQNMSLLRRLEAYVTGVFIAALTAIVLAVIAFEM